MTEKALELAKNDMKEIIRNKYPGFDDSEVDYWCNELIRVIDWDNSALMHKSISWIVNYYMSAFVAS